MSERGIWVSYAKDETVVVLPKKGVDNLVKMLSETNGWPVSERDAIQTCCAIVQIQLMAGAKA